MRNLFFFYFLLLFLFNAKAQKITYIGNMGVLINGNSNGLLIDGLHKKYKVAYQFPPEDLVNQLIGKEGVKIFDINYILHTHIHKDHFDAALVTEFMQQKSEAILIGPDQIKAELPSNIHNRLKVVTTTDYSLQSFEFDQIKVTGFFIDHANKARHFATKNVGFLLEINNKKILHLGDADPDVAIFKQLQLKSSEIDIAIIPDWLAMSKTGAQIIQQFIAPDKIIITHISPLSTEETKLAVKRFFPQAIFFTEIGQELSF